MLLYYYIYYSLFEILYSECMSGTHTCFLNFTFDDASDLLSRDQLETLKTKLVQAYHYQRSTSNSTVEIRKYLKTPSAGMCFCQNPH